ncbi:Uncharacterized protein Adt_21013 [Abeliophyllum distichum]|uniref:Uncharacterized protein n=1 Tax=Abeliophyllum distichum TaxID=126358 RepID=A0ABD1SY52_9LAMI
MSSSSCYLFPNNNSVKRVSEGEFLKSREMMDSDFFQNQPAAAAEMSSWLDIFQNVELCSTFGVFYYRFFYEFVVIFNPETIPRDMSSSSCYLFPNNNSVNRVSEGEFLKSREMMDSDFFQNQPGAPPPHSSSSKALDWHDAGLPQARSSQLFSNLVMNLRVCFLP